MIDSLTVGITNDSLLDKKNTLSVSLKGEGDQWFVSQGIHATLHRLGYQTYDDTGAAHTNTVRLEVMPVLSLSYDKPSRSGIFGGKNVSRTANVYFNYQLIENISGKILTSRMISKKATDTVSEDAIPLLEDNSIRATHAVMPEDNLFDRLIEPLVIVGAAGTAVYLFFHVRS
ncbi:MAG: hypothetical protein ACHQQQ_13345 [Bacteroidota bacterium]